MVRTSASQSTDTLAFTICRAFELCEIAEYEQAADLLPSPSLESDDPELLFVWGVTASGQGRQEQGKDLLTKAVRLLPDERASLARVYLALCYWRLGEVSECLALLDGAKGFCASLVRAIIATEESNDSESLALLAEVDLEGISEASRGKFHNQRGLAKAKTGDYLGALNDFDQALERWRDAPRLWVLAKNNSGRTYSKMGNLDKALECVDDAISLVNDKQLLGQFFDQRSKILKDHGLIDKAKIESAKAVSYLANSERPEFLKEAAETYVSVSKIGHCKEPEFVLRDSSPEQFSSQQGGLEPLTIERASQLIDTITKENDAEHAWEIIELLAKTADPKNEVAQQTMRRLFTLTEEFENEYQRQMKRFISPEDQSEVEH